VFVLRRAPHERTILNVFKAFSVRSEPSDCVQDRLVER
jgi:hypothetical protein